MNINRQQGAVMLETAYVLPLVLGVMLFIVEIVGFAMNSFAANDVLTDTHTVILSEVSDVANLPSGAALDPAPLYAKCSAEGVVLDEGENTTLTTHVKSALEEKGITFNTSQPISANISMSNISGFRVYVVNFNAVANSLVLPDFFEEFLPIDVDTIISIKDSCTS